MYQHPQLGAALGWKYNHESGLRTENGVLVRFPATLGAVPDDVSLAQTVTDYLAYLASPASKDADAQAQLDGLKALKAVVGVLVDKGVLTMAEVRAKYRALP